MHNLHEPEHYTEQLKRLLPSGEAWTPDLNSVMHQTLEGLGIELSRIDHRAWDLFNDAIPSIDELFDELLIDWERVVGLPDNCIKPHEQTDDAGCHLSRSERRADFFGI